MRVGIDVMGGDFAPNEILNGAILASLGLPKEKRIVLFGNESIIKDYLNSENISDDVFDIVHCEEEILMGDDPVKAFVGKKNSSITKGFGLLKTGQIDGFASAGNTGAMLVGATTVIGVVKGVLRPSIASVYPNIKGDMNLLLDVGINADVKPDVLYQFAKIGATYFEEVFNKKSPKVGLLNIGSEESKGNSIAKATYKLMKETNEFNFIGNVEGSNINDSDVVDVVVTDGFTGNVVLKQAESFYSLIKAKNVDEEYFENFNYENYGGTPILGINKTVVVGHGKSNKIAIKNMILHTFDMCKSDFSKSITKIFSYDKN